MTALGILEHNLPVHIYTNDAAQRRSHAKYALVKKFVDW